MPTYTYKFTDREEYFDYVQSIKDAPLSQHPITGESVVKVITAPNINIKHTKGTTKKLLSHENIAKNGFTKYEKAGDGHYVKTAGNGPNEIRR